MPTPDPERPFDPVVVDIRAVAAMLSMSRQGVEQLVARGELERVKLGRAARYRVADVLALVGVSS